MKRTERPVDAFGQIRIRKNVVRISKVDEEIGRHHNPMIAQHITEHHLRDALDAVEGVVSGRAIDDIRREIEFVFSRHIIAVGIQENPLCGRRCEGQAQ